MPKLLKLYLFILVAFGALALLPSPLRAQTAAANASKSAANKKSPNPKAASSPTVGAATASSPAASPTVARPTGNASSAGGASPNKSGPVKARDYRSKSGGQSTGTGPVNNSVSHTQPDEAVSRRYRTGRNSPGRKSAEMEKPTP